MIYAHSSFSLQLLNDLLKSCQYLYPWTCISHRNPSIHINTAYLITTKQFINKSIFQRTQQYNAVHVQSNLMIINNTCREQDLYLKSQSPTCLQFFQIILNCIRFHFSKEIPSDFRNQDFVFSFFELVTQSKVFFHLRVSSSKVKK